VCGWLFFIGACVAALCSSWGAGCSAARRVFAAIFREPRLRARRRFCALFVLLFVCTKMSGFIVIVHSTVFGLYCYYVVSPILFYCSILSKYCVSFCLLEHYHDLRFVCIEFNWCLWGITLRNQLRLIGRRFITLYTMNDCFRCN
jgi:hypothetical protein